MSNPTESLPIRQSDDGKWEVQMESRNCAKYETKKDADAPKVRLWTWQNRGFDITDPSMRVETKRYSKYLDAFCNQSYCDRHLKAYEQLWDILKTNQFHWYFTNVNEATNSSSLVAYRRRVLWELDVPENRVFKKICGMAWHWIVSDGTTKPANIFENLFRELLPFLSWNYNKIPFEPIFNQPWQDMKCQQLWDCLFAECRVHQCYDVLVRHPVDTSWVVKDPRKDVNWWQKRSPINNRQQPMKKV